MSGSCSLQLVVIVNFYDFFEALASLAVLVCSIKLYSFLRFFEVFIFVEISCGEVESLSLEVRSLQSNICLFH